MFFEEDEDATTSITDSTHIDPLESTKNLDNYAAMNDDGAESQTMDKSVGYDDTLDRIVAGNEMFDVDGNDNTNEETMPAEQDCDAKEDKEDEEKDIELLKDKNVSLMLEIKKKDLLIDEKKK